MTTGFAPEQLAPEAPRPGRAWRIVSGLSVLGALFCGLGIGLPVGLSFETPTPMPYHWPAQHAAYLHTDGSPTACRIDDGVHEPFTLTIPTGSVIRLAGRTIAANSTDATIACTAPTTVDLDPDLRYALADASQIVNALAVAGLTCLLAAIRISYRAVTRPKWLRRLRLG
jgi:hypothetical protein